MRSVLIVSAVLAAIVPISLADATKETNYPALLKYLSGSFSSEEQHKADADNFFDIRLHMTPIWQHRSDGYWLYVEQARANALDRPYRQRVYQLVQLGENEFESRVYELPGESPADALKFAGAWKDPRKLEGVSSENLKLKAGCSIFLKRLPDGSFEGATRGNGCVSTLRGAAYTTSEVKLAPDQMISWDRGWDKDGKQVWGAEKGGYIFKRIKE